MLFDCARTRIPVRNALSIPLREGQVTVIIDDVSALDELAAFVVRYCDAHVVTLDVSRRRAVDDILTTTVWPLASARQAVLYGFAAEVGAVAEPGFDPAWKPVGCR